MNDPAASSPGNVYREGSQWLHIWIEPIPRLLDVSVAFQVETVGVRITAAPYVMMTGTQARHLFSLLREIKGVRQDEISVSIPLDPEA